MQKIMQHQTAEPRPIESFRSDVPAGVIAIVKRMMAKQPEERFQTPASVALALMPFTRRLPTLTVGGSLPTLKGSYAPTGRDDTPLPAALAHRSVQESETKTALATSSVVN